ncbi:hypothetical protein [Sandaracinus amylolyticus]|uniref:hypothetical protein n=1 Tax=Sandaracinus amylolyticus TaxID=927083 RepID=UPI001F160B98|nr:hypothetical protein [Sandaracinus amylolyticus]
MLRACVLSFAIFVVPSLGSAQDVTVSRGVVLPGYEVVVAPREGAPRTLCEPSCELSLPRGEVRLGWRRGDAIEWQRDVHLTNDLRVDLRLEDRSLLRGTGHALLIAAGVLLGAVAIVGIATEPQPPDYGWFGDRHGLVFAGIAGGVVIALGVPGIALSLVFERDEPALELVPVD